MTNSLLHIYFVLFCICILNFDNSCAQENSLSFEKITTKDGLSNLKIYSIAQDNNGFIWIGTMDGLLRYDGYNFKVYRNIPNNPKSIPVSRIISILVAPNNILWLTTKNEGLIKFNTLTEEFTHFVHNSSNTSSLPFNDIWELYLDKDSTIWGTNNLESGFRITDKEKFVISEMPPEYNLRIQLFKHIKDLINSKYKKNCDLTRMSFAKSSQDNYWIATMQNGLYKFNTKLDKITPIKQDEFEGFYSMVSICEDRTGVLWIGKSNVGVFKLSPNKTSFTHYNLESFKDLQLNNLYVRSLTVDNNSNYWIGTHSNGLIKFNKTNNYLYNYKNKSTDKKSLSSNEVRSLYMDSENNLWIGTRGYLSKYNGEEDNFINYTMFDEDSVQQNARVFNITEDSQGNLWLSNWDNLVKFNKQSKEFKYFSKYLFDMDNIRHTLIDQNGLLWISAEYGGIVVFDPDTEKIIKRYRKENGLSNSGVFQVYQEDTNTFWAATLSGLNKINQFNNTIEILTTDNDLPSNIVMGIMEDRNQNYWLPTANGLAYFNTTLNKINSFFIEDGLQHNEFVENAFYSDTLTGNILVGGINGFNVFHPDSIYIDSNKPKVAFTNFKINNIEIIPNKAYNGRVILDKPIEYTNKIKLQHQEDKVISFEFSALHFNSQKNNKYAYMLEGYDKEYLYTTYENRIATYTNLDPGKYILKVIASNNNDVWNNEGKSIEIIIVPAFYQTLLFKVTFIILIIGLIIFIYLYRINSVRKQKIGLENKVRERTASLLKTNVTLEESKEEIQTQKDLLYLQNIELEKHQNNLESLVFKRTQELEAAKNKAEESDKLKSAFLANMSHEIRTPMNAIIGFSSILEHQELNPEEQNNYVRIINKSGTSLLALIDDILNISQIDSNQITINLTKFKLLKLLDEINQTFKYEFNSNNKNVVKFIFTPPPENIIAQSDYQRCKQIISNLLTNAYKYTKEGSITFSCFMDEDKIYFSIKDTGIGISKENSRKIFERFNRIEQGTNELFRGVGLGLSISLQLAHQLNGDISFSSEPGVGSEFIFWIPKK